MRIALWIALLAGTTSCGLEHVMVTLEGDLEVPRPGEGGAVVVPDVPVTGIQSLRFTSARELATRDVRAADIDRVQLESLVLTPEDDADLDIVDYVELFLDAPGQPEVPIAEKHVPDGSRSIQLDPFDDDLAEYARAASLSLRAAFQLRRPPNEELRLHVKARFRVDVASTAF